MIIQFALKVRLTDTHRNIFFVFLFLFLSPFVSTSKQQIISTLSCSGPYSCFQVWDLAVYKAGRTQAPYLVLPVFSQLTIPVFFPDYHLSGCAQIPFLTHQNGDIHLNDDICGEFLNNLIVISTQEGLKEKVLKCKKQGIITYKILKPQQVGVGWLCIKFRFGNSS